MLLASHTTWAVLQRPSEQTYENRPLPETTLLFRRNCELDDLARFGERSLLARFYSYIAGTTVPPDFAWVDLSIDYSACGDEEAAQLTLAGPLMVVELAVIENTTGESIEVGTFDFHESATSVLRPADAANEQPQRASWFAPRMLRPGERVLIPTRLILEFAPQMPADHTDRTIPSISDASALTAEMLSRFGVTPEQVAPLMSNPPPTLDRRLVWGPAMTLDDVQIEGTVYPIRAAASRDTLVLSGNEIGSCPYFSGYSHESGWMTGGTILRGRNSEALSGTDRRVLPAFDGRVLFEEREHEVTFIEHLGVEVLTEDGRVHLLTPASNLPLRLSFGDRVEVPFHEMPKARIMRATLIATGYYVPK
jgi:hypothetical protein